MTFDTEICCTDDERGEKPNKIQWGNLAAGESPSTFRRGEEAGRWGYWVPGAGATRQRRRSPRRDKAVWCKLVTPPCQSLLKQKERRWNTFWWYSTSASYSLTFSGKQRARGPGKCRSPKYGAELERAGVDGGANRNVPALRFKQTERFVSHLKEICNKLPGLRAPAAASRAAPPARRAQL